MSQFPHKAWSLLRRPRHPFTQKLVAYATGCAFLSSCAVQPQHSSTQQGQAQPTLQVGQKDHDPCSEANRRSEAFGGAIAGGLMGAALGALAGALIGKATHSDTNKSAKRGAIVGLAAGVVTGYNSGVDSYRRQCELFNVAKRNNAQAAFATLSNGKDTTGEVIISPDQGHFFQNSDYLTDIGRAYYSDIARQYTAQVQFASYEKTVRSTAEKRPDLNELKTYSPSADDKNKLQARWNNYRIVITGHTDDQQDATAAQILSENRAKNVAELFRLQGVPETSLLYQGAGASFPIADNRTSIGRQKNNRVEAIVLYDEKTLQTYAEARQPKYEYFSEQATEPEEAVQNTSAPQRANEKKAKPEQRQSKVPSSKSTAKTTAPREKGAKQSAIAKNSPQNLPATIPVVAVEPGLDLGGVLFTSQTSGFASKLGTIKATGDGLSIDSFSSLIGVGSAYAASTNVIDSCNADDPQRHRPGQIKKLSDGSVLTKNRAPIAITESYLFNTVRTTYYAPAGDHFVEVKNLTAKKTGELAEEPQFNLYLNYQTKSDEDKRKATTADYTTTPVAYSILGERGLLIRQFFPQEKGLVCMDMLIPNDQRVKKLQDTALVYNQAGVRKVVNLPLER